MEFTLFLGCNIPARVEHYEMSARAVLAKLGVGLADIREFNCCGYPLRNSDFFTALVFAARNLALAQKRGRDLMTLCKCCFGHLKKADYVLNADEKLRAEVNRQLAGEGLSYDGGLKITHFLSVLYHDIGPAALKEKITRSFTGLNIATHYGCHALRPSEVTQFDDPAAPVLFDRLVEVTGAKSIDWPLKLECCGAPLLGINDELSMDLTERKLADGKRCGADYLCAACPWCQLQFDRIQPMINSRRGADHRLPSIIFPQLLGLVMGIDAHSLGLGMNRMDIGGIEAFYAQE